MLGDYSILGWLFVGFLLEASVVILYDSFLFLPSTFTGSKVSVVVSTGKLLFAASINKRQAETPLKAPSYGAILLHLFFSFHRWLLSRVFADQKPMFFPKFISLLTLRCFSQDCSMRCGLC